MDFNLNEEQEAIKKMVSDFTAKEIVPVAAALDDEERYPREIIEKLDRLGLANLTVPEAYGGPGVDFLSAAVIAEELACGCAGVAAGVAAGAVALYPVVCGGSAEMKEKYLTEICERGRLAALALSEPEAGSNAAALAATYRPDGDGYLLNGTKAFVNGASYADYLVVFAGSDAAEKKEISAFLVKRDTPGISVGSAEKKLGLRAADTAGIEFTDVRVPASDLIGKEGDGMTLAAKTSDIARVFAGATGVGIARAALAEAISFARERVQFGKPIADNQAIQFMLADMAAGIEAAGLLVRQAAWALDRGLPCGSRSAIAKLTATETAMRITVDAVQVMGGYGYSREYPVEKYMRDAKTMQIYEGTGLVQRMIIARELLDQ